MELEEELATIYRRAYCQRPLRQNHQELFLVVAVERHQHEDADDEVKELSSAEVPLHSTSLEQIHEVLDSAAARVESDVTGKFFSQKMQAAMKTVTQMLDSVRPSTARLQEHARDRLRSLNVARPSKEDAIEPATAEPRAGSLEIYVADYAERYSNWAGMLTNDRDHPTQEQWAFMRKAHLRCVQEYSVEAGLESSPTLPLSPNLCWSFSMGFRGREKPHDTVAAQLLRVRVAIHSRSAFRHPRAYEQHGH